MPQLVRIESAGPDRRARRLHFGENAERLTSAAVVRALGLSEGSDVDLQTVAELEETCARERALQLVGYRERSVTELRNRLLNDGYPSPLVAALVDRFVELMLVDDRRFAGQWVRNRLAAGYGSVRIRRELAEKGVATHLIEAALEEAVEHDADDEHDRARRVLRGKTPADAKERERLIRRLVSRGFSLSVALAVVGRPREHDGRCDDSAEPFPDI